MIDDLGYRDDGATARHRPARLPGRGQRPPGLHELAVHKGLEGDDVGAASYLLSRMPIIPTGAPGMRRWRKKLFMALARNASRPVEYFGLPDDRTVTMGSHVTF